MPQKTRVGNDRSQSTTDVARRRNRNEKLYKAGARSSVTLAAQNADRRAAVSEIELALSTLSSRSNFSQAGDQRIQLDGKLRRGSNDANTPERSITESRRSLVSTMIPGARRRVVAATLREFLPTRCHCVPPMLADPISMCLP